MHVTFIHEQAQLQGGFFFFKHANISRVPCFVFQEC